MVFIVSLNSRVEFDLHLIRLGFAEPPEWSHMVAARRPSTSLRFVTVVDRTLPARTMHSASLRYSGRSRASRAYHPLRFASLHRCRPALPARRHGFLLLPVRPALPSRFIPHSGRSALRPLKEKAFGFASPIWYPRFGIPDLASPIWLPLEGKLSPSGD